MSTPEKQLEYARKYHGKLDEIKLRPVSGTKERWRAAAKMQGKSLQRFVIDAVEKEIEKITGSNEKTGL